jgi:hypothetical protein
LKKGENFVLKKKDPKTPKPKKTRKNIEKK